MSSKSYFGWTLSITVLISVLLGLTSAEDYTTLQIPQGEIQGKVLKSREGKTFNGFMGIPYAQAPKRFKSAQLPPPTWEDTYDATNYKEKCLQFNFTTQKSEGNEDCLFVNVFTPNTNGKLSVLAFIHGGGFQFGLAYENGPEFFMDHDVVFVTFSYRLAALGFLSTGDDILPGNLGLKDQTLALRWIQDNIEHFGGDKARVTLFGESAGAASVSLHVVSPLSSGLFKQAITQSGTSLDRWVIAENPRAVAEKLGASLNCPTQSSQELVDCLKEKSGNEIVDVQLPNVPLETIIAYSPVIETRERVQEERAFITDHPRNLYDQGSFSKVPMLMTYNDMEGILVNALGILASPETVEAFNNDWTNTAAAVFLIDKDYYSKESIKYCTQKIRDFYLGSKSVGPDTLVNLANIFTDSMFAHRTRRTALIHGKYAPVFTSVLGFKGIWSQTFLAGFKEILGMSHADDLSYFFTDYKFPPFPPGSDSEAFSKLLVRLWVNFAKSGNPDYEVNGKTWEPLQSDEIGSEVLNWMYLKNDPELVTGPFTERMLLWDHIDYVLESGVIPGKDEL